MMHTEWHKEKDVEMWGLHGASYTVIRALPPSDAENFMQQTLYTNKIVLLCSDLSQMTIDVNLEILMFDKFIMVTHQMILMANGRPTQN